MKRAVWLLVALVLVVFLALAFTTYDEAPGRPIASGVGEALRECGGTANEPC